MDKHKRVSERAEERNQGQEYNLKVIKVEIRSVLDFYLGIMLKV